MKTGVLAESSLRPRTVRRGRAGESAADLDKLSAAKDRYAGGPGTARSKPQRAKWVLPILAATIVGGGLMLTIPSPYRCTATFRMSGDVTAQRRAYYRSELLEYAWAMSNDPSAAAAETQSASWWVTNGHPDILQFSMTGADRAGTLKRASAFAEGYLARLEAAKEKERSTPTETEHVLSERASQWQHQLEDLHGQLEEAADSLPTMDPTAVRDTLMTRWEALRSSFVMAREQFDEANAQVEMLRSEPEPTSGIVPSDDRGSAMQADLALQQDLRELTVKLTELKLHLLNVWQDSAAMLEELNASCAAFLERTSGGQTLSTANETRESLDQLMADGKPYKDSLESFTLSWTREFTALKRLEVDPLSGELLEFHTRTRRMLNDFLFHAAKRLTAMRNHVQQLGQGTSNQARYHVLQSDLTRGFQLLQRAHHRFEFAAGMIEPSSSFRLDAALQGARGLQRRSQERIRLIDERLQAEAVERTRHQRTRKLSESERLMEQFRAMTDETVAELLGVQAELNLSAAESENYIRAILQRDMLKSRIERAKHEVDEIQKQARDLADRRTTAADRLQIQLVSCDAVDHPTNLPERLRIGGIGAVLTLLTVGLAMFILKNG